VAAFIGSPAMNLYEASISSDATQVKLGSQSLNLSEALLDAARLFAPTRTARSSSHPPEHLLDAALGPVPAPGTTLSADVELIEASATSCRCTSCSTRRVCVQKTPRLQPRPVSSKVSRASSPVGQAAGVARVSPRSELKAGSRATFAVDTERLNFFDNDNGAAIWLEGPGLWPPRAGTTTGCEQSRGVPKPGRGSSLLVPWRNECACLRRRHLTRNPLGLLVAVPSC